MTNFHGSKAAVAAEVEQKATKEAKVFSCRFAAFCLRTSSPRGAVVQTTHSYWGRTMMIGSGRVVRGGKKTFGVNAA